MTIRRHARAATDPEIAEAARRHEQHMAVGRRNALQPTRGLIGGAAAGVVGLSLAAVFWRDSSFLAGAGVAAVALGFVYLVRRKALAGVRDWSIWSPPAEGWVIDETVLEPRWVGFATAEEEPGHLWVLFALGDGKTAVYAADQFDLRTSDLTDRLARQKVALTAWPNGALNVPNGSGEAVPVIGDIAFLDPANDAQDPQFFWSPPGAWEAVETPEGRWWDLRESETILPTSDLPVWFGVGPA